MISTRADTGIKGDFNQSQIKRNTPFTKQHMACWRIVSSLYTPPPHLSAGQNGSFIILVPRVSLLNIIVCTVVHRLNIKRSSKQAKKKMTKKKNNESKKNKEPALWCFYKKNKNLHMIKFLLLLLLCLFYFIGPRLLHIIYIYPNILCSVFYVPRHILLLFFLSWPVFSLSPSSLALSLTISLFSFWNFHFVQKVWKKHLHRQIYNTALNLLRFVKSVTLFVIRVSGPLCFLFGWCVFTV